MSAPSLRLVILAVRDLSRARAFYDAAFGWEVNVDVPVYVEYRLPGGAGVGLYRREGFGRNVGGTPFEVPAGAVAPCELYLGCADAAAAAARCVAAGARLLGAAARRDWGDTVAYVADPDGNVLALAGA